METATAGVCRSVHISRLLVHRFARGLDWPSQFRPFAVGLACQRHVPRIRSYHGPRRVVTGLGIPQFPVLFTSGRSHPVRSAPCATSPVFAVTEPLKARSGASVAESGPRSRLASLPNSVPQSVASVPARGRTESSCGHRSVCRLPRPSMVGQSGPSSPLQVSTRWASSSCSDFNFRCPGGICV